MAQVGARLTGRQVRLSIYHQVVIEQEAPDSHLEEEIRRKLDASEIIRKYAVIYEADWPERIAYASICKYYRPHYHIHLKMTVPIHGRTVLRTLLACGHMSIAGINHRSELKRHFRSVRRRAQLSSEVEHSPAQSRSTTETASAQAHSSGVTSSGEHSSGLTPTLVRSVAVSQESSAFLVLVRAIAQSSTSEDTMRFLEHHHLSLFISRAQNWIPYIEAQFRRGPDSIAHLLSAYNVASHIWLPSSSSAASDTLRPPALQRRVSTRSPLEQPDEERPPSFTSD